MVKVIIKRTGSNGKTATPCEGAMLDPRPVLKGSPDATSLYMIEPVWFLEFATIEQLLALVAREDRVLLYANPGIYLNDRLTDKLPYRDYQFKVVL